MNLWGWKTYTFNPNLEGGRHVHLIWDTPSAESLNKSVEEERLLLLPACTCLASKSIPSVLLETNVLVF